MDPIKIFSFINVENSDFLMNKSKIMSFALAQQNFLYFFSSQDNLHQFTIKNLVMKNISQCCENRFCEFNSSLSLFWILNYENAYIVNSVFENIKISKKRKIEWRIFSDAFR
jgi:hypothetical protein